MFPELMCLHVNSRKRMKVELNRINITIFQEHIIGDFWKFVNIPYLESLTNDPICHCNIHTWNNPFKIITKGNKKLLFLCFAI